MTRTAVGGVSVLLPTPGDGRAASYAIAKPLAWTRPQRPLVRRIAYAAAHVVPLALADNTPGAPAKLDWDATMAIREDIWSYGLGVADAMDTAQRGMGLDWNATRELIARSGRHARAVGGALACGAGTDQLLSPVAAGAHGLQQIIDAYREQIEIVADAGATVVLMASGALARAARGPQDYLHVYRTVLDGIESPAILHWLGEMFDPALSGYWGSTDLDAATGIFLELLQSHAAKVDGVKVSLLDPDREISLRRELPTGLRLYTGDDFNYPEMIAGDGTHHSDALLGIFSAIYPAASAALQALDVGNSQRAREILDSTAELGRHIFSAPTPYYKTGLAFLSWINGRQPGFVMIGGMQSARSLPHLVQAFHLANRAGLIVDPDRAARRLRDLLAVHGWSALG